MTEKELKALLADMTLEEKVDQMNQVAAGMFSGDITAMGPMAAKLYPPEVLARTGSVLGGMGAEALKKLQKEQIEKQPHKIPMLFMLDVINGFKTVYPIPLGQGASFDPELSRECAAMAAEEAAVSGVHVTFAPMTDLVRDARWGRVMESTGEDPYLNSLFCAAMVKGFQGDNLREEGQVAACVKHFAGYGGATAGRDYNTVELSEHTFREFYLRSYEAGVKAGAAMVMTSFNTVNGTPATGNRWLMRRILREEMGFDGVLISDWAAIEEMIPHGYCADRKEAAIRAIRAGVDIDMMTGIYSEQLAKLVKEGTIPEPLVDEACLRILTLKNKLGLFENPFKDADEAKEKTVIRSEKHRALAKKAAAESFVLLKNEKKILPLKKTSKIAFVGPYVKSRNLFGSWSFIAEAKDVENLEEALKKVGTEENMTFSRGSSVLGTAFKLQGFEESEKEDLTEEEELAMLEEAVKAAKEAEIVVLAVGEDRLQSGEAASRGMLDLPEVQKRLFDAVTAVNENVVTVLFSGRPLDLREVSAKSKALLEVWMPGTEGAAAIAEVLFGEQTPQGKLPMSFPYCVGQVPVHYNAYSTGRPVTSKNAGERFHSRYIDIPNQPLYSFGYGLSYTDFEISGITLDREEMKASETIHASVTVKNTGDREGTETLQLYLHDKAASVVRPVKKLKGFQKITLQPGEEKKVTFAITEEMLRFLTEDGVWASEPGAFDLYIGGASNTENQAVFKLTE